jgi:hypothetical protein
MYLFLGMGEKCNFHKIKGLGIMTELIGKDEFSREVFMAKK